MMQCEFCEERPVWRLFRGDYERFTCEHHLARTQHLVALDFGSTKVAVQRERVPRCEP